MRSKTWNGLAGGYYWANFCPGCGALQGDRHLYNEIDAPFRDIGEWVQSREWLRNYREMYPDGEMEGWPHKEARSVARAFAEGEAGGVVEEPGAKLHPQPHSPTGEGGGSP